MSETFASQLNLNQASEQRSAPSRSLCVCIVTPALPPKLDGIGDYTSLLARQLVSLDVNVVILTDDRNVADPINGVVIRKTFDPDKPKTNWKLLDAVIAVRPDWVLVQYNPFGYGRRGLNLHLYRVLRQLKKSVPGARLAIMFHETYVPPVNVRLAIMAVWQRWQFKWIGRAADVMFYSISPWAEAHRRWFPGKAIYHLPVGSNIPRFEITKTEARRRLGIADDEVVLGVFGNAHTSRLFGTVRDAAEALQAAGRRVRILYIGADGGKMRASLGGLPAITDGPLPADEVSRRLSAVDIALSTYTDGVSTRRGAMMAALQHGLPVVGTIGSTLIRQLAAADGEAMLLVPARDSKAYSEAVVRVASDVNFQNELSVGALKLFQGRYSWPVIVTNMLNILDSIGNHP